MPYKLSEDGKQVIKVDTGEVIGTHETKEKALKQLRAIGIHSKAAKEKGKHKKKAFYILIKNANALLENNVAKTYEDALLVDIMQKIIPEVAARNSLLSGPIDLGEATEASFIQNNLQTRLLEHSFIQRYPHLALFLNKDLLNLAAREQHALASLPIEDSDLNNNIQGITTQLAGMSNPDVDGRSIEDILNSGD